MRNRRIKHLLLSGMVLAVTVSGCTLLDPDARQAISADEKRAILDEIETKLRSPIGAYYTMIDHPNLHPPSAAYSAYGLDILRLARQWTYSPVKSTTELLEVVRPELDGADIQTVRDYHYVGRLLKVDLIDHEILGKLKSRYQNEGFFTEKTEKNGLAERRLRATAEAAEVLRDEDPTFLRRHRDEMAEFLDRNNSMIESSPVNLVWRRNIEKAIGVPVTFPGKALHGWWNKNSKRLNSPDGLNDEDLYEIAAYVVLSADFDLDLTTQRRVLEWLSTEDALPSPYFLEFTHLVIRARLVLFKDVGELGSLIDWIKARQRTDNHMVTAITPASEEATDGAYEGGFESTYQALSLRRELGATPADSQLIAMLRAQKSAVLRSDDPYRIATWAASLKIASGHIDSDAINVIGSRMREFIRQPSPETVYEVYSFLALLDELGMAPPEITIRVPDPTSWTTGAAASDVSVRPLLVLVLHRLGKNLDLGTWRNVLEQNVETAISLKDARSTALTALALHYSGGLTIDQRKRIEKALNEMRGCAGSKLLYRVSAKSDTCRTIVTLDVIKARNILGRTAD
jgi:hypothetical protein